MRTDAKIGFAIVGVLLLVLAVYAVVIPRHGKTQSQLATADRPSMVKLEPEPAAQPTPPQSVPSDPSAGDPLHTDATEPAGKPAEPAVKPADGTAKSLTAVADSQAGRGLVAPTTPMPSAGTSGGTSPIARETTRGKRPREGRQPAAESVVASAANHAYRVRPGQTLSSIAAEVYGDSRLAKRILADNPGINPKRLKVGQRIMIPDPADVRPRPPVVIPAADLVVSSADAEDVGPVVTPIVAVGSTYRVREGDSLYRIARKCLGSGREADAIYDLNRTAIGPDMTHLRAGTVLRLPTPAEGALSAAVH